MKKEAVDDCQLFTLTSKLETGKLNLELKHYDLEEDGVSFFEL